MVKKLHTQKRFLLLAMTLLYIVGIVLGMGTVSVSAAYFENSIASDARPLRLGLILSHTCSLSISSQGIATIAASAKANMETNSLSLLVKLQRNNSGRWVTIAVFQKIGNQYCNIRESYQLNSQGSYRIVSTATANNTEVSQITDSATY